MANWLLKLILLEIRDIGVRGEDALQIGVVSGKGNGHDLVLPGTCLRDSHGLAAGACRYAWFIHMLETLLQ